MPLYEYKCNDCDSQFEELVTSNTENIDCPKCKSKNISKLLSVFSSSVSNTRSNSCGQGGCGSGFG